MYSNIFTALIFVTCSWNNNPRVCCLLGSLCNAWFTNQFTLPIWLVHGIYHWYKTSCEADIRNSINKLVSSLPRSRNMFSTQAVNMGVQGLLRYLVDQWLWLQTQLKLSTSEYKTLSDTWLIKVFCGSGPASRCLKLHQLAPSIDLIQAGWCKLPNILGVEISCWFVLLHYIWEMDPLFFFRSS